MPKTLLLADDSVTIQRVIELTFAHEDVRVVSVGDGEQRRSSGSTPSGPTSSLADVGMPEVDGYAIVAHVKKSPRCSDIPVLLLAGAFEPVDEGTRARERVRRRARQAVRAAAARRRVSRSCWPSDRARGPAGKERRSDRSRASRAEPVRRRRAAGASRRRPPAAAPVPSLRLNAVRRRRADGRARSRRNCRASRFDHASTVAMARLAEPLELAAVADLGASGSAASAPPAPRTPVAGRRPRSRWPTRSPRCWRRSSRGRPRPRARPSRRRRFRRSRDRRRRAPSARPHDRRHRAPASCSTPPSG